jgi:uncharacterized protein
MNLKALLPVLFFLSVTAPLYALDVPPQPDGYVTDHAGMLSPATQSNIERGLQAFETKTSNQVVLVTFLSLEEEALEDFSIRLAEQWKVGQKGKENGVILLIFKNERKIRIEVGYGLEGALPDALAGTIISREIAPFFRDAKYEMGILRGLQSILMAIEGEYQPGRQSKSGTRTHRQLTPQELAAMRQQGAFMLILALLGAGILFIFDFFRYRGYLRDRSVNTQRYSFWEWFFRFAMLLAVASILFRVMFYMMLFSRGGYGGSRGGGGFSGGGGAFGGGGASGRW